MTGLVAFNMLRRFSSLQRKLNVATRNQTRPEFTRLLGPERLASLPLRERLVASEEELRALAERFAVLSLERLEADIVVTKAKPTGLFIPPVMTISNWLPSGRAR